MRARDARDLARLAQAARSELTPIPLVRVVNDADADRLRYAREGVAVADVVLGHLHRSLSSEAARKRPARRPVDPADLVAPVARTDEPYVPGERFEWQDPGIGSITATREGPAQAPFLANLVTTSHGVHLDADGCRALADWLLAVADEGPSS